jgi:hypothetical protein
MVFGSNAVTTTHERSFAGLVVAHLAVTLVVCGGLVLLLPATASSSGVPSIAVVPVFDCAASTDRAGDQQFTDDADLDAPDSCDDDDDDDDAPTGSDAAIAIDDTRTTAADDVMELVQIEVGPWISRTVDGHSLRGPPAGDQNSSDADDDFDGDDDDPAAECSDLLPPATSRRTTVLTPVQFVRASSTRSSDLSLRAPPL